MAKQVGSVFLEMSVDDKKMSKGLNNAGTSIKKFATIFAAAFGVKKILDFGTAFETSLKKASTLIDTTVVDMENLEKEILNLSNASGIAADELNEGLYQALSAGIPITEDAAEAMAFMERMTLLARGGFTDVTTAIDATTSVINAYGLSVADANDISNILIKTQNAGKTTVGELGGALSQVVPIAAAMGVSFDEVGASLAALTAQGVPTAQAATQMKALFSELSDESGDLSDVLKKQTGKSFQELVKEGKSVAEIIEIINDEAVANEKSLNNMFGSIQAGQGALSLTGKGAEIFEDALLSMRDETDAVTEASDIMADTVGEKLNNTMNQFKNILIDVFLAIAPVVSSILDFTNKIGILKPALIGLLILLGSYLTILGAIKIAHMANVVAQALSNKETYKGIAIKVKDIAVSTALIIKTIALAVAKAAMAVAGIPIVGPALAVIAGIAVVAGIIGAIAGISSIVNNMAEGGIVSPTSGGTIARIGEAGSSEAVVPLTSKGINAFLGGVMGNGQMVSAKQKQNIIINVKNTIDEDGLATLVFKNWDDNVELHQPSFESR